jgi:lysozyme family protein
MNANLPAALAYIDEDEGPEVNISPNEPGGESKHGVSLTFLTDWRKTKGLSPATIDDVAAVTSETAAQAYTDMFAVPLRFDELPGGADYRLLDIAVNLGLHGGITALQLALGLWPLDGVMDDDTVAFAKRADPKALVLTLGAVWISKKHESPNWGPSPVTKTGYGHGWMNRCNKANARALALIVPPASSQ